MNFANLAAMTRGQAGGRGFTADIDELHRVPDKLLAHAHDITDVPLMPRRADYGEPELVAAADRWVRAWEKGAVVLREEIVNVAGAVQDCATSYDQVEQMLKGRMVEGISIVDMAAGCRADLQWG